jgi:hypothetical protein
LNGLLHKRLGHSSSGDDLVWRLALDREAPYDRLHRFGNFDDMAIGIIRAEHLLPLGLFMDIVQEFGLKRQKEY